MMNMEYKECNIKGFEGLYHIYEDSTILSLERKKLLLASINVNEYSKYSYLYVTLYNKHTGLTKRMPLHRVIAHHYIKPIVGIKETINGSKLEVNHKDLDKLNNHYTNLEIVTHQQNMVHARQNKPNWSEGINRGRKMTQFTKDKMSVKKNKKVLLFTDTEHVIYDSIAELCKDQNIYRKKFWRAYSKNGTINGYNIRYL